MGEKIRKYGCMPFKVCLIHGGPGALGEMAPVAEELSKEVGVLEPLLHSSSIEGELQELLVCIEEQGNPPIVLIGSSWGAMLGFIFAAKYPKLVQKLILVGSGIFEAKYAKSIMQTRMSRLTEDAEGEFEALSNELENSDKSSAEKDLIFARLGELIHQLDSYDRLTDNTMVETRYYIYKGVWEEARKLRESGDLLNMGKEIKCPVVAIHGDYDPHPSEGVYKPLSKVLANFQYFLLEKCGHTPWQEKFAKDSFYKVLRSCLNN